MYRRTLVLIFLIVSFNCIKSSHDRFYKELFIKPLHSGHINAYFQFTTEWLTRGFESLHDTHFVAQPLAEIIAKYDLFELHVSLTNGVWRYENWGYPVVDAPPGAELIVWFNANNRTDDFIDEQWKELSGILSGLFCASFSFVDKSNTIRPEYTFRPTFSTEQGLGSIDTVDSTKYKVRYATLPREIVCTENLTPWMKMLPGNRNEGLRSLLNSGYIHTTNYHSLGLHIRRQIRSKMTYDMNKPYDMLEVKQTVNLVFDRKITSNSLDWTLRSLFGQSLNGACELAQSTKVYVDVTDANFVLKPTPDDVFPSQRGGTTTNIAVYDITKKSKNGMFPIAATYPTDNNEVTLGIPVPPPLYAKRYLLGVGQEHGKIVTKITNNHWTSLNVIVQENLPWFIPISIHSLKITVHGANTEIKPNALKFSPGILREKPSELGIAIKIPDRTTIDVVIDFEYVFLKWLEYPPDANHGHYIGSAVVVSMLPVARNYTAVPLENALFADSFNASRSGYLVNMRTEALLITLPTPDFSMPYNVICLTCTVVALAFGPIHNFATKKLTVSETADSKEAPKSILDKIKALLSFKK